ncbi:hypothetical protein NDI44_20930 [Trichocoleus sp. DQ-A3]|uniref:hypothetical protein n=1 Tax=Coleofasciculus sp. FACHB-125 TaxID=2692784 RepID=UPI0016855A5B|nr:hypothetical protein [Coleofasciculus sp. FACHB-125]MBD1903552.1 hypothetical protein [Coleofasciculus sp. FACHB-125]
MVITHLHKFLTTSTAKTSKSQMIFWFTLSLTFALIYSSLGLKQAFSSSYVVQDDARVYVFWMQRFVDSGLFPNDFIADYFQAITPSGYAAFYRLIAFLGIEPLGLSKLLPVFLTLLTTAYCFAVCMEIFPVPTAGFISTLLLNQNLSMRDDLVSSTPRSFIYLFFLAFLYYLLRRSLFLCLGAIALAGLFYPPLLFILAGILILRLWRWDGQRLHLSKNRLDYLFGATGLGFCLLAILPYALKSSEVGPAIAGMELRSLPAFSQTGRIPFFDNTNPLWFWLFGQHSGLLPNVFEHPLSLLGLFLPILMRYPDRFPLIKQIASNITILPQIALASFGIFVAAHAMLYKLFAPARYTRYSFKLVMILSAAIVLVALIDTVFKWAKQQDKLLIRRQFIALGFTTLLGTTILFYPYLLEKFPNSNYVVGKAPALYEFFQKQPKNILIASLSEEVDNLPTFSQRAILVGWEYANPYHVIYERQIRQRATDLIHTQYTQNLAEIQNFIQTYDVDFFLLDRAAFTSEYITNNPWFRQWQPLAKEMLGMLDRGMIPAMSGLMQRCSVFETGELVVLQAKCMIKATLD